MKRLARKATPDVVNTTQTVARPAAAPASPLATGGGGCGSGRRTLRRGLGEAACTVDPLFGDRRGRSELENRCRGQRHKTLKTGRARTFTNTRTPITHSTSPRRGTRTGTHENAHPGGRCCRRGSRLQEVRPRARGTRTPSRERGSDTKRSNPHRPGAPTPSLGRTCADTKGPGGDTRGRACALRPKDP